VQRNTVGGVKILGPEAIQLPMVSQRRYKGVTRVLLGCYKGVKRVSHGSHKCYKGVTRVLQGYYKGITRVT
jgi:hypothetical protein